MPTKTVRRRTSGVALQLMKYLSIQKSIKDLNKELGALKTDLTDYVEANHEVDPEKKHKIHTLPEGLDFLGQRYTGFMRQRKVSQVFLEDKAEALAKKKAWDEDDYTTRYVDQDKFVRLYAEDKITDKEWNSLFSNDVTWAFVPVKE